MNTRTVWLALCLGLSVRAGHCVRAQPLELSIELPGNADDMALDVLRDRVYVSIPSRSEVVVISLATLAIVDSLAVGASPLGLDLSDDHRTLYAALGSAPAVSIVDLEIGDVRVFNLNEALGSQRAFDVSVGRPDRVFVSGSAHEVPAWIAQIKFDQGEIVERAANPRFFLCGPTFAKSPGNTALYVGECLDSLYKLDLLQDGAPVVAEDRQGTVSGTQRVAVSPDGALLITSNGQVLSAETINEVGRIGDGIAAFGDDPGTAYVATAPSLVEIYDLSTFESSGEFSLPCTLERVNRFVVVPGEESYLVLGDDVLCGFVEPRECSAEPSSAANPTPSDGVEWELFGGTQLRWGSSGAGCPNTYDVYIGAEDPPSTLLCEGVAESTCEVPDLVPGATYFWQVVSRNSLGETPSPIWSFTARAFEPEALSSVSVDLGATGSHLVHDPERKRLYVSVPERNEIVVVSTETYEIADRIVSVSSPHGLDLSIDGTKLFAALRGTRSVAFIDVESGTSAELDIGPALGDLRTYDVIEAIPNRLFVSADPGDSGFAWIVMVRLDEDNAVERVASGKLVFCSPTFAVDEERRFLYVGECFSPNSLYKLDLSQGSVPIVLEKHGSVGGTSHIELSRDGERLYLAGGQVLRSSSFNDAGSIEGLLPRFGDRDDIVFALSPTDDDTAAVHSASTFSRVDDFDFPCNGSIRDFMVLPDGEGWLTLRDDTLCGLVREFSCEARPPSSAMPSPKDGERVELVGPVVLKWANSGAHCPNRYDVLLGTENPPTEILCTDLTEPRCLPGKLTAGLTYYWQVVARNELGETASPIWSFSTEPAGPTPDLRFLFDLGGPGGEMVLDIERDLLYASVPSRDEIVVASMKTLTIVDRVPVGSGPHGIALSEDGAELLVALRSAAAVTLVDLDTRDSSQIDISMVFSGGTRDVVQADANRVFVSGEEGVVVIYRDDGDRVESVIQGTFLTCEPFLELSPDRKFLYVGDCSARKALVKLDLSIANPPPLLESPPNSLERIDRMVVSPDGARVFTGTGQVVRTDTLSASSRVPAGAPAFGSRDDLLYVAETPDTLALVNTDSMLRIDSVVLPCDLESIDQLIVLPDDSGWALLGDGVVCGLILQPECSGPPAAPTIVEPAIGSRIELPSMVTLRWDDTLADCPSRYDVYLDMENPPSTLICEAIAENRCFPQGLEAGQTYYWQVVTKNAAGETPGEVGSFETSAVDPNSVLDLALELGAGGGDMELDTARRRLYVSLPTRNSILVLSTVTFEILDEVPVGPQPRGLYLSHDGRLLYIALTDAFALALLDLDSLTFEMREIGEASGEGGPNDVIEVRPGEVFVAPGGGRSWFVYADFNQSSEFHRLEQLPVNRCRAFLEHQSGDRFLYAGCGTDLRKLDFVADDMPLVLSDRTSSLEHLEVSPDGTRIVLGSGQVLRTGTFGLAGQVAAGVHRFDAASNLLYAVEVLDRIQVYDAESLVKLDTITLPCEFEALDRIVVLPEGRGWAVLGDDLICGIVRQLDCVDVPPESTQPEPPSSAVVGVPSDVQLRWSNPGEGCPNHYDVLLDTVNPPESVLCRNLTLQRCDPGALAVGTTYYWRVIARNSEGEKAGPIWSFNTVHFIEPQFEELSTDLGGNGADLEYDVSRDRLYVSLRSSDEIAYVDAKTLGIVDRVLVGSDPRGIDLGHDNSRLFVALHGTGSVAMLDVESGDVDEIIVGDVIGDDRTFDVIVGLPHRVFVSASAGSDWRSTIGMIKLDEGNVVVNVASGRTIDWTPVFELSRDQRSLYIGERFPSSLYKLNLTREDVPLILEDRHGSVAGTSQLGVSPDGKRIHLGSGQVLRTGSFSQVGRVGPGLPRFGERGDVVYVATGDGIEVYETSTFTKTGDIPLICPNSSVTEMVVLPDAQGWIVLADDVLCGLISSTECLSAPPVSAARFPADGAALEFSASIVAEWSNPGAGCPTTYDVYFGTENPPTTLLCANLREGRCRLGELEDDTEYFWQVVARNARGETAGSVWTFSTRSFDPPEFATLDVALDVDGAEMEFDPFRSVVYVSQPEIDEIAVVSLRTLRQIDRLSVELRPRGIDLSHDGTRLFVAQSQALSAAILDLETRDVTTVNLSDGFVAGDTVWDIAELRPEKLFVSGRGVVTVHLDEGNRLDPALNPLTGCLPVLAEGADGRFLYVGECFNPNSLYKLDTLVAGAPVVLEDDHGSVSGTSHLEVSPDGSRIYLASGQVLRTESFFQLTQIEAGIPRFGDREDVVYVATSPSTVKTFDTVMHREIDSISVPCDLNSTTDFLVLPEERGWLLLAGAQLCGLVTRPACADLPAPVEVQEPAASATGIGLRRETLRWSNAATCPQTYDVYFDTIDPPERRVCSDLKETVCDVADLSPDTVYYWQVVTRNDLGTTSSEVWSFTTQPCPTPALEIEVTIPLSAPGFDLAEDPARGRFYVSLPESDAIAVISTETFEKIDSIDAGPAPRGIDLSHDGTRLFVADSGAQTLEIVDLVKGGSTHLELGEQLRDGGAYDVVEALPDRVFVSADPGSGGLAWIVMVKLDEGKEAIRVASERIIRCAPTFGLSPDGEALYVGECFSPNSLYKLDLTQPDAPIVDEDDHGSVGGTSNFVVGPDGSHVFLRSGQVVRTNNMTVVGRTASGVHAFGDDPEIVYVAENDRVSLFDTETLTRIDAHPTDRSLEGASRLLVLPRETGWLALLGDEILGQIAPQAPDCNGNGLPDSCDIARGASPDLTGNGVPDECELPVFMRGDINLDANLSLDDPIVLLNYLFLDGPDLGCPKSADANDDGRLNITDPIYTLAFLFLEGPTLARPFPECGADHTEDGLQCSTHDACP